MSDHRAVRGPAFHGMPTPVPVPEGTPFKEGELLELVQHRQDFVGGRSVADVKVVTFLRVLNEGEAQCVFGAERLVVPVTALRRAQPNPIDPKFKPVEYKLPERDKSAETRHRDALRKELVKAQRAREAVVEQTKFADGANRALASAHAQLRVLKEKDASEQDAYLEAVRKGQEPPATQPNGIDRDALQRRVETGEAALAVAQNELRLARAQLEEAEASIRSYAAKVVAAVVDGQAELYQQRVAELAHMRSVLAAACSWSPSGDVIGMRSELTVHSRTRDALNLKLEEPEIAAWEARAARNQRLSAPFAQLYQRLLDDADAQLEELWPQNSVKPQSANHA